MFHTLAWQGFSLSIPLDWNLTRHQGSRRLGAITLADLHQTQLELRWQTLAPRRRQRTLDRIVRRLTRRHARVAPFSLDPHASALRIDHDAFILLLISAPTRLYELSWNRSAPQFSAVAASFRDHASRPLWPWRLYGLAGQVPAALRLRKTLLLPGRSQLDFAAFRRRLSLGSWSLADRLLAGRSLRDWAAASIPLLRNHPAGRWLESPDSLTFHLDTPSLFGPRRTTLHLEHLPDENLIRWQRTIIPRRHPSRSPVCPAS